MSVEEVVAWYEKNVNYKLTKAFLNFLVKTGIVKYDVDLELLNMFLLETFDNDFVKDNNKFKIKKNRIPIIDSFKEEKKVVKKDEKKIVENKPVKKEKVVEKKSTKKEIPVTTKKKTPNRKFKIENLGGRKLKLVKI